MGDGLAKVICADLRDEGSDVKDQRSVDVIVAFPFDVFSFQGIWVIG